MTAAGMDSLKGLTDLVELNLDSCEINDDSLKNLEDLKRLESLNLASTPISDAGLEHLKGLTALRTLDLSNVSDVTEEGIQKLKKSLPECHIKH
jgi:Leucine-rich repeat (LRR) protein